MSYKIPNTSDGTDSVPRLKLYISKDCVKTPQGPQGNDEELYTAVKEAGYEGLQDGDPSLCQKLGLEYSAGDRVNQVGEVADKIQEKKDLGYTALNLHVGWGIEDDATIDALIGDILEQATKAAFPVFVETHRATITQDLWRTVELVKRFPEIKFNGDFSHWYTGNEMIYGDWDQKVDFIQPVLDRVGYMHGRIGNPGCIQVDIGDGTGHEPFLPHFIDLWTKSFKGFQATAMAGDFFIFCPELLFPEIFYARTFPDAQGIPQEESNRWQQALVLTQVAQRAWQAAQN